MKKIHVVIGIVVVLGILMLVPASDPVNYGQIEQAARTVANENSNMRNFDISISEDKVVVIYECDESDIPITLAEAVGVYAGIVDADDRVGDLYAYVYNSNGDQMISFYCLKMWAKDTGTDEQSNALLLDHVVNTISWY